MSHGPHGPAAPEITRDPRLKEGWRAATAAIAAFKQAVPEISDREAMLESVAAVSYASHVHPKWLYALYKPAPRKRD